MRGLRAAFTTLVVGVAVSVAAPAALASNGALSQLPGQAACVNDLVDNGPQGLCQQAVGLGTIQSIAISPDGGSLYTASLGSGAVAAFSRNTSTGLLTQVPGGGGCIQDSTATPEAGCTVGTALKQPDWVSVSPNDANVYASSTESQAVDAFSRDSSTGALTQLSGSAACVSSASATSCSPGVGIQGPGVIALSPDGKNAYVALFGNSLSNPGGVGVFSVGSDGSLTQLSGGDGCILDETSTVSGCSTSPDSVLRGVGSVTVSPDGNFVYVAARTSGAVTVYARDSTTGELTRVAGAGGCYEETGTSPCASDQGTSVIGLEGPNSIAMSPDGSYVYVSSFVNGGATGTTVAVFSRDPTTGALTQLPGSEGCFSGGGTDPACTSVPVLDGPFAVTTSPDGSSVYVTDYGNNTLTDTTGNGVTVFSADPNTGALTPLSGLSQCVSASGSGGACAQGTALTLPHETVVSPDGNFVYVAGHQDNSIDIFATVAPASTPPSNSVLPSITTTVTPGATLTATGGTWSGSQTGYAYQWEDCNSSGASCTAIAGANGYTLSGGPAPPSYTLTSNDNGHTLRVLVSATNSAGTTSATSAPTAVVTAPPAAPSNTALPAIAGNPVPGQRLTASTGGWSGGPSGYSYQWTGCGPTGANCAAISGATSNAITPTAAEVGGTVRVVVTATNSGGSTSATSAPTAIVASAPAPQQSNNTLRPLNTALPAISGLDIQGQTVRASQGSWKNSPTSFSYQWQDCNRTGSKCAPIAGATSSGHKLTAADVGHTIVAVVTVANAGGSASATSAHTVVIARPENLVTCTTAPNTTSDQRDPAESKRLKCSVGSVVGAVKLPHMAPNVSATISHGRTVYEVGTTVSISARGVLKLVLTQQRALHPGRYTLVLHASKGRVRVISLIQIAVS